MWKVLRECLECFQNCLCFCDFTTSDTIIRGTWSGFRMISGTLGGEFYIIMPSLILWTFKALVASFGRVHFLSDCSSRNYRTFLRVFKSVFQMVANRLNWCWCHEAWKDKWSYGHRTFWGDTNSESWAISQTLIIALFGSFQERFPKGCELIELVLMTWKYKRQIFHSRQNFSEVIQKSESWQKWWKPPSIREISRSLSAEKSCDLDGIRT